MNPPTGLSLLIIRHPTSTVNFSDRCLYFIIIYLGFGLVFFLLKKKGLPFMHLLFGRGEGSLLCFICFAFL
jgi:hypothetical protein